MSAPRKRGRPPDSGAKLLVLCVRVAGEQKRLRNLGKRDSVLAACKSLDARHYATLAGAYWRALRTGGSPRGRRREIGVVEFITSVNGARMRKRDALELLSRWGVLVREVGRRHVVDLVYLGPAKAEFELMKSEFLNNSCTNVR